MQKTIVSRKYLNKPTSLALFYSTTNQQKKANISTSPSANQHSPSAANHSAQLQTNILWTEQHSLKMFTIPNDNNNKNNNKKKRKNSSMKIITLSRRYDSFHNIQMFPTYNIYNNKNNNSHINNNITNNSDNNNNTDNNNNNSVNCDECTDICIMFPYKCLCAANRQKHPTNTSICVGEHGGEGGDRGGDSGGFLVCSRRLYTFLVAVIISLFRYFF